MSKKCYIRLKDGKWDIRNHNFKVNKLHQDQCKCGFILPMEIKRKMEEDKVCEIDIKTGKVTYYKLNG